MEKKNSFLNATVIGIASTWFGMHCGSGFATGTQYIIYYNKYGWLALITPILTWLLVSTCFYFMFEYTRQIKGTSYKDYANTVFIKKIGIVFVVLFDLTCVFGQILGEAGILAGSGSLFEQSGLSYTLGVLIAGGIVLLMAIFGAKAIMKISSYLTAGLIVCIVILGFVGVTKNWANFSDVIANHRNDGGTFWDAVKSAFTYSGVQITSFFALSGLCGQLSSSKDTGKAALVGGVLNLVMLEILGLVMISSYPTINSETLPVLAALTALNIPVLTFLYKVMLFLALITTGAGCAFAIVTRFKGYVVKWFKCNETVASAIIAVVLMSIGFFGSKFGLVAVFSKGYGYLSKLSWPLLILPALILVPIRLQQMKKAGSAE